MSRKNTPQEPVAGFWGDPYPEDAEVLHQLAELREMIVRELQEKHLELYGFPTRSRHKQQLFKRLAWRIQELKWGGLSERTKRRLEEIADDLDARFLPPRLSGKPGTGHREVVHHVSSGGQMYLSPGTVLSREYGGQEHRVTALAKGFEYGGSVYRSLSAVAREITGTQWNGKLFFGLTKRKPRRGEAAA